MKVALGVWHEVKGEAMTVNECVLALRKLCVLIEIDCGLLVRWTSGGKSALD